jgi:hypothetical protein
MEAGMKVALIRMNPQGDEAAAVVAQASDQIGFVAARLDKGYLAKVRASIPVERHHVLQQAA